jgi:DNA modification methylase
VKLKISEIKLNPNNPRTIKDDKFKKLVQSIKEFPEMADVREVVVNKEHMILGGNMRFQAMKEAGWSEIPVRVVDWSEDKQREFVIKDNVSGGDWDWDLLANEWDTDLLEDWGLELPGDFGEQEEIEEDEAPEVDDSEPPISKLGEVYKLGRHRVMCGDSTDFGQVSDLLDGQTVDMVYNDPPYGMFLNADYSDMKNNLDFAKAKGFTGGKKYDDVIGDHDDFNPLFIELPLSYFGYCKEIIMWGANYYAEILPERNKGSWFVWDKRLDDSADKMYGSTFELAWSKAKHKQDTVRVKWAGVFGTEKEFDHKRHHPTQKPIELSAWFINNFSKSGNNVVDLFLGSGSTLIACEQTDRTCYGMELDCRYVDVIRKRYAKFIQPDNQLPENWEELTAAISDEKQTESK